MEKKKTPSSLSNASPPNFQLTTNTICCKIYLKTKTLILQVDVKNLNVRIFENNKADLLVRDISVQAGSEIDVASNSDESNSPTHLGKKMNMLKVLRIPEESYLLVEGEPFGEKVMLLRNVFLKCKIVDVNIHPQILKFVAHFSKLVKSFEPKLPKIHEKPSEDKIRKLAQEPIFLIRSLYAHPINLCLTVKTTPNMDFSNMITIPEFSLISKCFRPSVFGK